MHGVHVYKATAYERQTAVNSAGMEVIKLAELMRKKGNHSVITELI